MNIINKSKILNHLDKLQELKTTGKCFPVHLSLSGLTDHCSKQCEFCSPAVSGRKLPYTNMEYDTAIRVCKEFKELGGRAVTLGGGGDMSVYPRIAEFLKDVCEMGLEIGVISNGFLMSDELINSIRENTLWCRLSLTDDYTYETVLENANKLCGGISFISFSWLVDYKNIHNLRHMLTDLSRGKVKTVIVKNYYSSSTDFTVNVECAAKDFPNLNVIYNHANYEPRQYDKCWASNLTTEINCHGEVFMCCENRMDGKNFYGNINIQPLKDILDCDTSKYASVGKCPKNCRLNAVNNEIEKIIYNQVKHENFI